MLTLILSILKEVENSSTLQDDISGCFAFFSLLSIHIANLFGIISSMGLIGESLRFTIANQRIKKLELQIPENQNSGNLCWMPLRHIITTPQRILALFPTIYY